MHDHNLVEAGMQPQASEISLSCRDFLEGHTEYVDGVLPERLEERFERHLERCSACQRYDQVVRRSLLMARNLPDILPSATFHERLQTRLLHVDAEPGQRPIVAGTATGLMVAAVLALIAITPMVRMLEPTEPREPVVSEIAEEPPALVPFGAPALVPLPDLPVTAAVLVHTLEPSTFSPVVVSPPAVQNNPATPRFISYPLLQPLTR
jgi:anti-sigma factor RsiW